MSTSVEVTVGVLAILGYLVAPVTLVWGWAHWSRLPKVRTISSILSLTGFVLASTSALLAISTIAFAQVHRFPFYDPLLMRIYAAGFLLSLGAVIFGISGVWRANSLRWHAPVSGIATLAFWFLVASME